MGTVYEPYPHLQAFGNVSQYLFIDSCKVSII